MSRRQKHEEHENHERWLVSYADFITLLFAFFTVLYATSQSDKQKMQEAVHSMQAAFSGGFPVAVFESHKPEEHLPSASADPRIGSQPGPVITSLQENLTGSLSNNVVQIGLIDQDLVVVIPERLLFEKGSAEIHPAAFTVLTTVAEAIRDTSASAEVIGHADGVPLSPGSPFQDNWGLAAARAVATVRHLEQSGLPAERLRATSEILSGTRPDVRAVTIRAHIKDRASAAEILERLPAPE